ncbi:MAG: hypothetical protein NC087_05335 [Anaeroplasma bactoclasticum]|nr:hypothetical protein [Anaeroplasma bactoclasticum]
MIDKLKNFIIGNPILTVVICVAVLFIILVIIIACVRHRKKKQSKKANENITQTSSEKDEEPIVIDDPQQSEKPKQLDPVSEFIASLTDEEKNAIILHEILESKQEVSSPSTTPKPQTNSRVEQLQKELIKRQSAIDEEIREIEELQQTEKDDSEYDDADSRSEQIKTLTKFLQQQRSEQIEILNQIMDEKKRAKELSDKQYQQALDNAAKPSTPPTTPRPVVQSPQSIEESEDFNDEDEDDDDDGSATQPGFIPRSADKPTLQEQFKQLSAQQKSYFTRLRDYADAKQGATARETPNVVVVGVGHNPYIRLSIKRNMTYARFRLENEDHWKIRYVDGNKSFKAKETPLRITNDQDFIRAKELIDARVEQVEKEKEYKRKLRNEKRRKPKDN